MKYCFFFITINVTTKTRIHYGFHITVNRLSKPVTAGVSRWGGGVNTTSFRFEIYNSLWFFIAHTTIFQN